MMQTSSNTNSYNTNSYNTNTRSNSNVYNRYNTIINNNLYFNNNPFNINVSIKITSPPYHVLEYLFLSNMTTKNMFGILCQDIQSSFGLTSDKYHIVVYQDSTNLPCNRNIITSISQNFGIRYGSTKNIVLCINVIEEPDETMNQYSDNVEQCPVCLENEGPDNQFSRRYNCSHTICVSCFNGCLTRRINNCPLCRQPVIH